MQALDDTVLGKIDRVQTETQLGSHRSWRSPVERQPLKCSPRHGLKFALDQFHQPAGDVPVMLAVPELTQLAVRIFELTKFPCHLAVAGRQRPALPRPPEHAQ